MKVMTKAPVKPKKKEHPSNKKRLMLLIGLGAAAALVAGTLLLLLDGSDDPGKNAADTLKLTTPYCELRYPSEYAPKLDVQENNESGIYTKQFGCQLESGPQKLFAVHFGQGAGGELFGYLPTDDGKIAVYIECYESPAKETLTEEEWQTYYFMMDAINEVATSISEVEGYSTN